MKKRQKHNIAWIDGKWGTINELTLPLQDRGLQLADGIFETILILQGQIILFDQHLKRWQKSAALLGMTKPPDREWLMLKVQEAIKRSKILNGALRINWSRGNQLHRGINVSIAQPNQQQHRFWLELNATEPNFKSISVLISRHEKRNAYSQLSHCKTFAYNQAIKVRREAHLAGYDDALLLGNNQEICCGSTANLLVKRKNQWLTPRLQSGCLPGVMRQQAIDQGLLKEVKLRREPENGDQWLLINSLSCHPITKINKTILATYPEPKDLWLSLLETN